MRFHFDEAAHRYTLDDLVLPSVTQILKPIAPDLSMVPVDVLERKRQLGQAVHRACELDDNEELDEDETDELVLAYVKGWRKFLADAGAKVSRCEQRLYHEKLRYAGTLDRELVVDGARWLVDIKTVHPHPVPAFGVQLAGYELLLPEDTRIAVRASVHLLDDGTYRLKEYKSPNDYVAFRALLSLEHWKKENMQ